MLITPKLDLHSKPARVAQVSVESTQFGSSTNRVGGPLYQLGLELHRCR